MQRKLTFRLICVAVVLVSPFVMGNNAKAVTVSLRTSIPRLTSPTRQLSLARCGRPGLQRFLSKQLQLYTGHMLKLSMTQSGNTLHGTLTAVNLKPNFAYQLKLAGNPDMMQMPMNASVWPDGGGRKSGTGQHGLTDKTSTIKATAPLPSPNDNIYISQDGIFRMLPVPPGCNTNLPDIWCLTISSPMKTAMRPFV